MNKEKDANKCKARKKGTKPKKQHYSWKTPGVDPEESADVVDLSSDDKQEGSVSPTNKRIKVLTVGGINKKTDIEIFTEASNGEGTSKATRLPPGCKMVRNKILEEAKMYILSPFHKEGILIESTSDEESETTRSDHDNIDEEIQDNTRYYDGIDKSISEGSDGTVEDEQVNMQQNHHTIAVEDEAQAGTSAEELSEECLQQMINDMNQLKSQIGYLINGNHKRNVDSPSGSNVSGEPAVPLPQDKDSSLFVNKLNDGLCIHSDIVKLTCSFNDMLRKLKHLHHFNHPEWIHLINNDVKNSLIFHRGFANLLINDEIKEFETSNMTITMEKAFASLTYAMLLSNEHVHQSIETFVNWMNQERTFKKGQIENKLKDIFFNGDYKDAAKLGLTLVCGYRTELIKERRDAVLSAVKDPIIKNELSNIPPSVDNLFEAQKFNKVLENAGGVRMVFSKKHDTPPAVTPKNKQQEAIDKISKCLVDLKKDTNEINRALNSLKDEQTPNTESFICLQTHNNVIENKMKRIQTDISELQTTGKIITAMENIISELKDIETRDKNIIMTNVKEATDTDRRNKKRTDKWHILGITRFIDPNCPEPKRYYRIGVARPGKFRPLKISFENAETVKNLLSQKHVLKPLKVDLFPDIAPQQKGSYESLKRKTTTSTKKGTTN